MLMNSFSSSLAKSNAAKFHNIMAKSTENTKNIILHIMNLTDLADSLEDEWQGVIFGDEHELGGSIATFRSLITELENTTARIKQIFEETAATKP